MPEPNLAEGGFRFVQMERDKLFQVEKIVK